MIIARLQCLLCARLLQVLDTRKLRLTNEVTRQISHLRCQQAATRLQAPHHTHQSQGRVEIHHQTLNHMMHHRAWLLDRFLRHGDGKHSYKRNWKRAYTQTILRFGEKMYVDKLTAGDGENDETTTE
eukprot:5204447-Amphidinium_carterae.2